MNNSYAKAQEWGFATCLDKGLSQGEQESPRINRSLLFLELQPLHALVSSRQVPWALVNFRELSSTLVPSSSPVSFRQLSCALVNFRAFSSTLVRSRQLPRALVISCELSSTPVSSCQVP